MIIEFTVPGLCVPKSYGYNARGWYKSKSAKDWESIVGNCALIAARELCPSFKLHTGPVHAQAIFWLPIPASDRKHIKAGDPHCRKSAGDLTNLWKSFEDGMKGVIYRDDGQVYYTDLHKYYTDAEPHVDVKVELL